MSNRMVKLARRPKGMVTREDFTIEDGPVPEPGPGEFRVKIEYISLDPAMRGWMNDTKSYVAAGRPGRGHAQLLRRHRREIQQPGFQVGRRRAGSVRRAAVCHLQRRARPQGRHQRRLRCSAGSAGSACRAGPPISGCSRWASPRQARRSWCRRRPARSAPWWARSPRSRAAARSALPAGPTSAATSRRSWASTPASTTRRGNLAAAAQGRLPQGHRRQFRERRRRNPRHRAAADERVRPHRAVRPDLGL